jgi:DNA polymerase-1
MPDGLSSQMVFIKDIVRAYGFPLFELEGYEADDLIATLARKAADRGMKITIVSSDKDILQLVNKDTQVLSPGKDETAVYDTEKVVERFGVSPERITDIVALMGDSIDNIPGVKGIGEKTAQALIAEFGSLDKLLSHPEKIKQEKVRSLIEDNIDKIRLNKELAVLEVKAPVDFSLSALKVAPADTAELFKIFKHLEFRRFLKDLPQEESKEEEDSLDISGDGELAGLIKRPDEIFFHASGPQEILVSAHKKTFRFSGIGKNLKDILQDGAVKKTGHDLKKSAVMLSKEGVVFDGYYFDTMIAGYLANPSRSSYALADLALDYLDEPPAKSLGSLKAIDYIIRLKARLQKELKEKELDKLFTGLEMPLSKVLAEMELNGIKIDTALLKKLSREIEKKLIKLIDGIYEASGTQFNINSPKQLAAVLFEKLKLPVIKKTKTGASTDEEVLNRLADKHRLPAMLLEYRQLMKLKNTYIDTLPELIDKDTGMVHTSFNQTGTETGRLSSSNPNLQNIPVKTEIGRNIRKAVVASGAKNLLVACDYSQVELRILAHFSGDKALVHAFKHNLDIHRTTAAKIHGLEEKGVTDEIRDTAKRVNFGIIYGLTGYGLSRDLGIAPDEAQGFIDAYFATYPQVKEYIENQIKQARKDGFVTTILGRRRYLPEINSKSMMLRQFAERQAVNTPLQGSAADLIKLAMIKIDEDLKKKRMGSRMTLQIHDELLFDVPQHELEELVELAKERMENVLKLNIPIRVDIKKGENWLEMEPA